MTDTLSDDEFHRMQMQIIELKTENYQLKDENKKFQVSVVQLQQNTMQMEREINKLSKMKKALTSLGKSKQAHEFEELLQQNEQAFIMQNQTLMEELSKLQANITKLENEKKLLQQDANFAAPDKEKESELRSLKAKNTALQKSITTMQETHNEEIDKLQQKIKAQSQTDHLDHEGDLSSNGVTSNDKQESLIVANCDPLTSNNAETDDNHSTTSSIIENNLAMQLQDQSKKYAELELLYSSSQEEKKLIESELHETIQKNKQEVIALNDSLDELKTKFEHKQQSYVQLQSEMAGLQTYKAETSKLVAKYEETLNDNKSNLTKLKSENNSLQQSLTDSHKMIEQKQHSVTNLEKQLSSLVEGRKGQNVKYEESLTKVGFLEKEVSSLNDKLKNAIKEKDEAVALFQKSTHASTALIAQQDNMEKEKDKLREEIQAAKNLAEKRKEIADKQAIENQELTVKLNSKIESIQKENEDHLSELKSNFEKEVNSLKETNSSQEQELIRLHQVERSRTRELDGLQQEINDLATAKSSLENSKGWFERALKDAEKATEILKQSHQEEIDALKVEHEKEVEKVQEIVTSKDSIIQEAQNKTLQCKEDSEKYQKEIEKLKQDVKDEIHKQKLVEKKVHTTLKDLKKQLTAERKKTETLQEKLKQQSNSNVEELLTVVNTGSGESKNSGADGGSSVSSFSFKDFISPKGAEKPSPNHNPVRRKQSSPVPSNSSRLTSGEYSELLDRITELQNDKWNLEEKVKHLEESAGAMADELLDKSHVIQQYVTHTRTDTVKRNTEEASPSLRDKVRSFVTGNDEALGGIGNLRELNKKLTRMLEEEMTKNIALKQDMEIMAKELSKVHMSS